jgi:hypothetical protein
MLILCPSHRFETEIWAIQEAMGDVLREVHGDRSDLYTVEKIKGSKKHFALPKREPVFFVRRTGVLPYAASKLDGWWNHVPNQSPLVVVPWVNNTREGFSIPTYVIPRNEYNDPAKEIFDALAEKYNLDLHYHLRVSEEFDREVRAVR